VLGAQYSRMFLKMDKKILITLIIVLVTILLAVFLFYKYIGSIVIEVENTAGGSNTEMQLEQQSSGDEDITDLMPEIEVQANSDSNDAEMLIVCLDKCGDSICHDTEKEWQQEDKNSNSICPENPQECPQDCK